MISENIKPKKVATLNTTIKGHTRTLNLISDLNRVLLRKFIKIEESKKLNTIFKIQETVFKIQKLIESVDGINSDFSVRNMFINTIKGKDFYIGAEATFNKSNLANHYDILISFYALDSKATIVGKNFKTEILIPEDSYVYQVSNDNTFNAYQLNGKTYLIRDKEEMERVRVLLIGDKYYKYIGGGKLLKTVIIDNTDSIVNNVINSVNVSSANIDNITSYFSMSGDSVNLPKSLYSEGSKFKIEILGKVFNAEYATYNLSKLNPTIKGKVRAVLINNEAFLSDIEVN